jgi:hypothetical protein
MDITAVLANASDNEVEDAFDEAYETLAAYNDISNYDLDVERDVGAGAELRVIVHISSMAGDPTAEQYKNSDVLTKVDVNLKGVPLTFTMKELLVISSLDYDAVFTIQA